MVDAALSGSAPVRGANIAVVAEETILRHAGTALAVVANRTGVAVVADGLVGRMNAQARFIARIVGAGVLVIAVQRGSRNALTVLAEVVQGASVAIGAGRSDILYGAAAIRQAEVLGARISVVALQGPDNHAHSLSTVVPGGTTVVVIAGSFVGGVLAPHSGVAEVVGADIGIVAGQEFGAGSALARLADVSQGAKVTVITGRFIEVVHAAEIGHTTVRGAWVYVVAVEPDAAEANAVTAAFTNGAGIAVVTGCRFVGRDKGAITGCRGTGGGQTLRTEAFRLGTFHNCRGNHLA